MANATPDLYNLYSLAAEHQHPFDSIRPTKLYFLVTEVYVRVSGLLSPVRHTRKCGG